jgi:pimeloyl-ACP methyl ester carboxylesterase
MHDAASSPMAVSAPFVEAAKKRSLFLAVPRGPGKSADKRFGWGSVERATAAVDAAVAEGRKRAGDPKIVVFLVGVGRGGTEALTVAARKPPASFAGAGSINGPFDPGAAQQAAGLRGEKLFLGISLDSDPARMGAFRRGVDALKQMRFTPVVVEWPGTGDAFPREAARGAADVLEGFGIPAGR